MDKLTIKNRKKQGIAIILEKAENPKGLAFVMHGLGGIKEAPQIEMFAHCFLEKGYTTVRFDTTNSFGESDGKYESLEGLEVSRGQVHPLRKHDILQLWPGYFVMLLAIRYIMF
jgi:hypothetical protein